MQTFFISRIDPDILMNVLEECAYILYLGSLHFVSFYLKQKQKFSVWSFNENTFFFSIHGRIWSKYTKVNKFKKKLK